ncbi:hypothetical protein CBW65_00975 [Tumebacillus avium]|uniref:Cupin type-2 domain-containing protein n=1 Tax=Tumebacillus avium TaxID=1903704 RepID=A0A1Y0II85_9BACL|nr:CBO0543 family protein [Tumebacillus avium]ARU59779.1 hypothetical protein CBW65_00975 [Tumebacillus avium]
MPYIILFLVAWAAFFLFADRSRWRRFLPACTLAMVMSLTTDVLVTHVPIWRYYDLSHQQLAFYLKLLDDFGIYPVTTYLFLQLFPHASSRFKQVRYFFYWTTYAITLELLFSKMGWMVYSAHWSLSFSYLADWLIYFILLRFFLLFEQKSGSRSIQGLQLDFLIERGGLEIVILTAAPGALVPKHRHASDEMVVLLGGALEMQIAGEEACQMELQKPLYIPQGVLHSSRSVGTEPAVVLCVLMPASLRRRLGQYSDDKIFAGETLEL